MPDLEEVKTEPEKIYVKAYDHASAYDLRVARDVFEKRAGCKVIMADPLLVQLGARTMIAVFDYGSLVFFNVEQSDQLKLIETLRPCALRVNRIVNEDDYVLYLVPKQKKPEGTDELYIREFNRDIALVVSVVLSRSVSVEYYEKVVADALARLEQTISRLAAKGWVPRRERELAKQVGFALSVEHELAYNISVLDDPDVIWDGGPRIVQLYSSLKREFDLVDRTRIIQQKISIISRSSTFVISRLEAQRAMMLEWIIIALIFSEILLALFGKV